MDFPTLIGPYYSDFSRKAEIESCTNLRLSKIESGQGRNPFALYKAYGTRVFGNNYTPTPSQCRGLFLDPTNDHLFDVQGDTLYDVLSDGTLNPTVMPLSPIQDDGKLVSMDSSRNSLFIVGGGVFYRVNSAALQTPDQDFVPAALGVLGGYVICIAKDTDRFYFSRDDGVTWDPLDFEETQAYPNNLLALVVDHQQLWLFGNRITQVFQVTADPNAPFSPISAGVIEMGIASPTGWAKLDNSIFWLGRNRDGEHQVWRANGYSPQRVSNNAVEAAIRSYPSIDDAIMQSYTLTSPCIRLTFPSANNGLGATWEYDVAADSWYQPAWWNPILRRYERHRGQCYTSAFGTIIVGDYANGFLYTMSEDNFSDCGFPLRWERRTPHSTSDGKNVQYKRFELFMQTGVGSTVQPVWLHGHGIPPATFTAELATLVGAATITPEQAVVLQSIYDWTIYDQSLALPGATLMATLGFFNASADPRVSLRWSRNGGETYTAFFSRSIGRAGSFSKRIYWTYLGMDRDRVWEISGDAPVKTAIVQGTFDAVLCDT